MIEPTLRDRLITVYASWLDRDDFGPHDTQVFGPQQDHGVNSVRQFLEELIRASSKSNAFVERPPALDDPDGTFLRLLGSTLVSRSGPPRRVEAVAHQVLCLQVIPRLVSKVLSSQGQFDNGMLFPGPNLPEAGSVDADALRRWIDNPVNHAGLAEALMTVLKAKLARRTIRSFFTVDARATAIGCGPRTGALRKMLGPPSLAMSFTRARATWAST